MIRETCWSFERFRNASMMRKRSAERCKGTRKGRPSTTSLRNAALMPAGCDQRSTGRFGAFACRTSSINLSEVIGHYAKLGIAEREIRTLLEKLRLPIADFGTQDAFLSGLWGPIGETVGLSLGDRACLALAKRLSLPVIIANRAWASIGARLGVTVELIR